jgi:hypothetical protein
MISIFSKRINDIIDYWETYQWEISILISLCVLLYLYIYSNDKGTWKIIPPKYTNRHRGDVLPHLKYKREYMVRTIVEDIFNETFPTKRPTWLRNPKTNRCLEIDCCNENLKLGVEVDGIQHRKYTPNFHKSEDDFKYQLYKDRMKDKICNQRNFTLIRVPDTVPTNMLKPYMIDELKKQNRLPIWYL